MCDELYPVWMQQRPDGYCRGCQLIRQLLDSGRDEADESERELSAARQQFDEQKRFVFVQMPFLGLINTRRRLTNVKRD